MFSHGYTSSRHNYSVGATELAAHGYVVFCPDHQDESCAYTLRKGHPMPFPLKWPNLHGFNDRIHTRRDECIKLIDEIEQTDYLQTLDFEKGADLDMSKLVVAGHSNGGSTAMAVAEADSRVKCLLTHDPWLYPLQFDIWGKFGGFKGRKVDTQNVYTGSFYEFSDKGMPPHYAGFSSRDQLDYLTRVHMAGSLVENIKLEGIHHSHQHDRCITNLLDVEMSGSYGSKFNWFKWPKGDKYETYQAQYWMWLEFLTRNGYGKGDAKHLNFLVHETFHKHDVNMVKE